MAHALLLPWFHHKFCDVVFRFFEPSTAVFLFFQRTPDTNVWYTVDPFT